MMDGLFDEARRTLDENAEKSRERRAQMLQKFEQSMERRRRAFDRPPFDVEAVREEIKADLERLREDLEQQSREEDAWLQEAKAEIAAAEQRHRPG